MCFPYLIFHILFSRWDYAIWSINCSLAGCKPLPTFLSDLRSLRTDKGPGVEIERDAVSVEEFSESEAKVSESDSDCDDDILLPVQEDLTAVEDKLVTLSFSIVMCV